MAGSVNKVILVGNLGKDPEVRATQSGTKIVNLSIATSESWKDRQSGEWKENTQWHKVVVWNDRIADYCEQHLRKGAKVFVEGQLETRKFTDQSGQERWTTEVVLRAFRGELTKLVGSGDENGQQASTRNNYRAGPTSSERRQAPQGGSMAPAHSDLDDEIPF